jgi:hypothetical protein
MLFSALIGLIFVIGCGDSAVKQEISEFLKLYSDTVSEYEAADESKRAQMKEKIDSFRLKWSAMIGELNDKVTPQVMNKMVKEYEEITKKYASLNS